MTEKEGTTTEGTGWERETWTAMAWGTQESGKGELPGDAMAGGGDTEKAPSVAANKVGPRGRHGARPANRVRYRGRRENQEDEYSEVQGNDRGCEASRVAHESPGVGAEEGGREASRVWENPRGSRQGVNEGVELPEGTDTPGVLDLPRRDETLGVRTAGEGEPREDGRGRLWDETPPTT